MSDGVMMQYIPNKKIVPYAVVFVLVYFGAWNCNQYFDFNFNLKYYAECSPARSNARPVARNTSTNAVLSQATKAPTPTPNPTTRATTAQSINCIQHGPVDLKDPHHAIELHPVSRLHEIQAKLHQPEPIFNVLGHRGEQNKNNLEYNVQVVLNDKSASAWAHTKRRLNVVQQLQCLI